MSSRLSKSGILIDPETKLNFSFDGKKYFGFSGDSLASALLANNKTIAILDFDVNDDLPKGLVQLGTAIPIFLISDLSEIKSLDIVERKKIQALLD